MIFLLQCLSLILKKIYLLLNYIIINVIFGSKIKKKSTMDVTIKNFEELLPKIKNSIANATFISIDCELTGLNTTPDLNAFDSIKEYYRKNRRNCKEFLVIQFGVATFRYDEENDSFKQSSYNFYIFRKPSNRNIPDQRFLCQSSSIDFLISKGFDFNKLFKEGISYLNDNEEQRYLENVEESRKLRNLTSNNHNDSDNKIPIPDIDQSFVDEIMEQIHDFIKSDSKELYLPKCNPFRRKLIYQTAAPLVGNQICLETKHVEKLDRVLVVTRVKSQKELDLIETEKCKNEDEMFDQALGFSKVLRFIVESGKLVVGHNMLLDMLHTIDKFLVYLPYDYEEFKDCAHSLFSNVLDTKFMCSSEDFSDVITSSALGHLVESIREKPFKIPKIDVEESYGYSLDDHKEHEAAYDAYITGVSLLAMWKYLGDKNNLKNPEIFKNFDLLVPYCNKIFLMKLQDNPFLNLAGNDPILPRDHVFYVTFPKEWKLNDVQQLFSPFGSVYVDWLTDSSAYVGLHKREQAKKVLNVLSENNLITIVPYADAEINQVSPAHGVRRKLHSETRSAQKKFKRDSLNESSQSQGLFLFGNDQKEATSKNSRTPSARRRNNRKTFSEDNSWE